MVFKLETIGEFMKKTIILMCCFVFSGCVSILIQKEVQIKKDANGKIIETIEIEKAIQRGSIKNGLQFDYLKSKQDDPKSTVVY